MIPLARKNLFSEKTKFITSISGVALSVLLIFSLLAIYLGSLSSSRAYPENASAQFWIVQKGTEDLFHTPSLLPAGQEDLLQNLPGVISASAIINHPTRLKLNDKETTVALIGFDTKNQVGGPWKIHQGRNILNSGEVIIDRSFARNNNLKIRNTINLGNKLFEIVGISSGTNTLVLQYIFISNEDAKEIIAQENLVNYYLLGVKQFNFAQLEKEVQEIIPNSEVKTKETMAKNNARVTSETFLPILALLLGIGFAVGITIIGLTIHSATTEKSKEYGVLKAIGIKNRKLYFIVLEQALISAISGFIIGLFIFWGVRVFAFYFVPSVVFDLPLFYYFYVFLVSLLMSVIASYIPIKKINSLDPVEVFKP